VKKTDAASRGTAAHFSEMDKECTNYIMAWRIGERSLW
jgi:hypothetical protein